MYFVSSLRAAVTVGDWAIVFRQVIGTSELIVRPGLINVDFADVREIIANSGTALIGIGTGTGKVCVYLSIYLSIRNVRRPSHHTSPHLSPTVVGMYTLGCFDLGAEAEVNQSRPTQVPRRAVSCRRRHTKRLRTAGDTRMSGLLPFPCIYCNGINGSISRGSSVEEQPPPR